MERPDSLAQNTASGTARKKRILLLCDYDPKNASTVVDNIDAFRDFSRHEYTVLSGLRSAICEVDLSAYDGIFLHYSLVICHDHFISPAARRKIRAYKGYKAMSIQDEYRYINRTTEAMNYLRLNALFSVVPQDAIDKVYPPEALPGVRKVTQLTGYVPDNLIGIKTPPYESRPIDVSYRARKVPAYYGEHSVQKWKIADLFGADAKKYGLNVDLSTREEDRIYGKEWVDFVANSKAVLGTESGASVCDFTGQIEINTIEYTRKHPEATFEELREMFFKKEDGAIVISCISPRCFEAAALRTLMIMYEGYYSGALEAWKHYVPLKTDHSNMDEVVAILRDPVRAKQITDTAYEDLIASHQYDFRSMVRAIDDVMDDIMATGEWPVATPPKHTTMHQKIAHAENRLAEAQRVIWLMLHHIVRSVLRNYPQSRQVLRFGWRCLRSAHYRLGYPYRLLLRFIGRYTDILDFRNNKKRLLQQIDFFANTPDAEVQLYYSAPMATLTLRSVPLNTPPDADATPITADALLHAMHAAPLHALVWENKNRLGLGDCYPFEERYPYSAALLKRTRQLHQLLLAHGETMPWARGGIYQSAK